MINNITHRLNRIFKLIRLKPFDCSTEEGRSNERYRRVALTALASAIAKFVSMLTVLISVPLTLHYLGPERYGMWMTISSIIVVLGFADLGMGNGLLNTISDARGRNDQEGIIRSVSSTFFMLAFLAIILGAVFTITYKYIPWIQMFKISSPKAILEAGPATAVFIGCFLLSMPLGLVQRIQLGYQEGYHTGYWAAFGSILGLLLVLLVIYFQAGLPWLVLAMSGSQVLALLFNNIQLLSKRPFLYPVAHKASYRTGIKIVRKGLLFFVLQIAVAVAFASDNIVIAQILGPEAVTQYSVPMKMFSIVTIILSMVLNPLWPAYGESIARGDLKWVKRTLYQSLIITFAVTTVGAIILTIFGVQLIHLWTGSQVTPTFSLLLGLGVWTVLSGCGNALAMFLNGANLLKFQVIMAVTMASTSIVVKITWANSIGISGIIWGTVCTYIAFTILPCLVFVPRFISKLGKE